MPILDNETIKEYHRKINEEPHILESFPLTFQNGSQLTEFKMSCAKCQKDITWTVHGKVIDSLPTVKTFDAVGYCQQCNCFNLVNHRIREEDNTLKYEYINPDGEWVYSYFTNNQKPENKFLGLLKKILFPFSK